MILSLAKSLANQMSTGHKTSEALGSRTRQNRPPRSCGQSPSSPAHGVQTFQNKAWPGTSVSPTFCLFYFSPALPGSP